MNEAAGIDDHKIGFAHGASMFVPRGGENLADDVGIDQVFSAAEVNDKDAVSLNGKQGSVFRSWCWGGLEFRGSYQEFLDAVDGENNVGSSAQAIAEGFQPGLIVHDFQRDDIAGLEFQ